MLRWGKIEPGTAAIESSRSRKSAVRMLVSWRQPQRSIPTTPRVGSVGSWRSGRIPLRRRWVPWVRDPPFEPRSVACSVALSVALSVAGSVAGFVSVLTSDRHLEAVDESHLEPDDDVLPDPGEHQQAHRDEEQSSDVLQRPAVTAQPVVRGAGALPQGRHEDEGQAQPDRVDGGKGEAPTDRARLRRDRRGHGLDGPERRTHARGPPDRERGAEQGCACETGARAPADGDGIRPPDPEEEQSHDEDDGAAQAQQRALVLAEGEPDGRDGGCRDEEDHGEAENEEQRPKHEPPP